MLGRFSRNSRNSKDGLSPAADPKLRFRSHYRKPKECEPFLKVKLKHKPSCEGQCLVSSRSVEVPREGRGWRLMEPGLACVRFELSVSNPAGPLELRLEEHASPNSRDGAESCYVDVRIDGEFLEAGRRPAGVAAGVFWVCPLPPLPPDGCTLDVSLAVGSAPWNYFLRTVEIVAPPPLTKHLPTAADVRDIVARLAAAPNPAPCTVEKILEGVPETRQDRKRREAEAKADRRRSSRGGRGGRGRGRGRGAEPLPEARAPEAPLTPRAAERARKLDAQKLADAKKRAHAALAKEYAYEKRAAEEKVAKEEADRLAADPFEQELRMYEEKYGDDPLDAYNRLLAGGQAEDPGYLETKRLARARRQRHEEKKELPDPFEDIPMDEDLDVAAWLDENFPREDDLD